MKEVLDDITQKNENGSRYATLALICSAITILVLAYYFNRLFLDLKVNNLEPAPTWLGVLLRISVIFNLTFVATSIYKRETPIWFKWLAIVLFSATIVIIVGSSIFF